MNRDLQKDVFEREFTALSPAEQDLILEADLAKLKIGPIKDVQTLSDEIQSNIQGATVKKVIDLPVYKAIVLQGTINANSLGSYSSYFVDSNSTDAELVGDRVLFNGHTTQIIPATKVITSNTYHSGQ